MFVYHHPVYRLIFARNGSDCRYMPKMCFVHLMRPTRPSTRRFPGWEMLRFRFRCWSVRFVHRHGNLFGQEHILVLVQRRRDEMRTQVVMLLWSFVYAFWFIMYVLSESWDLKCCCLVIGHILVSMAYSVTGYKAVRNVSGWSLDWVCVGI